MKIVIICTNADLAGAPIHVKGVVNGLRHKVNYICIFGEHGPVTTELRNSGIEVLVFTRLRSHINLINDTVSLIQILKILYVIKPDVVHLHSTKAAMLGRIACFIMGIPWVYTVHGWGWRGFGKIKSKLIFSIESLLSKCSNGYYLYVSKSVETDGISDLRIAPALGKVVFNSVQDLGYYKEPAGLLTIFMAARVCSAKDHETLIKAFELVKCPSKLILCGSGTDSGEFYNNVLRWAPCRKNDIELMGVRTDVRLILPKINVFTLISNFEALPLSIIEAMASCRAVIASDVGGVSELVVHNYSGLLVQRGDFVELAACIEKLADSKVRYDFGKNGRKLFEDNFKEEKMLDDIWGTYLDRVKYD
jgi:glycosyltransferase involved in cell wall biosynthesis